MREPELVEIAGILDVEPEIGRCAEQVSWAQGLEIPCFYGNNHSAFRMSMPGPTTVMM